MCENLGYWYRELAICMRSRGVRLLQIKDDTTSAWVRTWEIEGIWQHSSAMEGKLKHSIE